MSEIERIRINVLKFQLGKKGYDEYAVQEYLRRLPNLTFFEIVDKSGKFKSLTRMYSYEILNQEQTQKLKQFISSVENNRIVDLVNTVTDYISPNTTAI